MEEKTYEEFVEEMKLFFEEHKNDTGFPPKNNDLVEATIHALNNLDFDKIEEKIKAPFIERLYIEEIYLENTFEQTAVRIPPPIDPYNYAKVKGGEEYQLGHGSNMAIDAILERIELTKEEYDNY